MSTRDLCSTLSSVELLLGSSCLASPPGVGGAMSLFPPVGNREGELFHFWTKEVKKWRTFFILSFPICQLASEDYKTSSKWQRNKVERACITASLLLWFLRINLCYIESGVLDDELWFNKRPQGNWNREACDSEVLEEVHGMPQGPCGEAKKEYRKRDSRTWDSMPLLGSLSRVVWHSLAKTRLVSSNQEWVRTLITSWLGEHIRNLHLLATLWAVI